MTNWEKLLHKCSECEHVGLSGLPVCHKKHDLVYKDSMRCVNHQYNYNVLYGDIDICPDFEQHCFEDPSGS